MFSPGRVLHEMLSGEGNCVRVEAVFLSNGEYFGSLPFRTLRTVHVFVKAAPMLFVGIFRQGKILAPCS